VDAFAAFNMLEENSVCANDAALAQALAVNDDTSDIFSEDGEWQTVVKSKKSNTHGRATHTGNTPPLPLSDAFSRLRESDEEQTSVQSLTLRSFPCEFSDSSQSSAPNSPPAVLGSKVELENSPAPNASESTSSSPFSFGTPACKFTKNTHVHNEIRKINSKCEEQLTCSQPKKSSHNNARPAHNKDNTKKHTSTFKKNKIKTTKLKPASKVARLRQRCTRLCYKVGRQVQDPSHLSDAVMRLTDAELMKLHLHGHAPARRILKFLTFAIPEEYRENPMVKLSLKEIERRLLSIVLKCKSCLRTKKPSEGNLKKITNFRISEGFNQDIELDVLHIHASELESLIPSARVLTCTCKGSGFTRFMFLPDGATS
jgi:hypothetical protein